MQKILKSFRNIFYIFKGIKEVGESRDIIYYRCLKCGSDLKGNKNYGKLRLLCNCGRAVDVYTGENIHFKSYQKKPNEGRILAKEDRDGIDERSRLDVFEKHIDSDLKSLYNIISNKRDITQQARYKECLDLLVEKDNRDGYEKILKYLQKFCDLDSVPLNVVWEPLHNQNTLSTIKNETNILGTTYFLPLRSILYYTVYLNPKGILNNKRMLATIAHELSHIYADHNNIRFILQDNDRGAKAFSEQMTDLLGIVLGMGELMCTSSNRKESFNTGYLTNEMICKSYKLWASDYLSGGEGIKTLIVCSHCSQKLKVPIGKKKLNLVCPKCKKTFMY